MLRNELQPKDRIRDLFNQLLGRINFEVLIDNDNQEVIFKAFEYERDQRIFSNLTGYDESLTIKFGEEEGAKENEKSS